MDKKVKFTVSGMSCAACSSHVNDAVSCIQGVKEVNVSLLTNSMYVVFDERTSEDAICEAVEKAGYKSSPSSSNKRNERGEYKDDETRKILMRLVISFALLVPLFYFSMGYMNPNWGWPLGEIGANPFYFGLLSMCLSLTIMLVNYRFFVSGFRAFIHRSPNMDSLVALGSGISFVYGVVVMFLMSSCLGGTASQDSWEKVMSLSMGLTFETSGMVPSLITIGKTLESFSKGKTTNAIKDLLDLSPKEAHVLRDGKEMTILTEEVNVGDVFLVRPGESIPVDGVVDEGASAIDESSLSGESVPVDKNTGDRVYAGTINQNGALRCKASEVGEKTTIHQIVKMVEEASMSKAKISTLADKVAGVFVPVVLLMALLTFIGWLCFGGDFCGSSFLDTFTYALERGVAVLVVACPCALGLATPVAVMVSSGKGAKNGILFKTASSLEETGKVDFVLLDKTGTLTIGTPVVTDIIPSGAFDERSLLSLAYALESNSEHPLAKAIISKAKKEGIAKPEVKDFQAISGSGVSGNVFEVNCLGGKLSYFERLGLVNEDARRISTELGNQGKTPLLFAKGHEFCGIIAVSDTLKDDSKEAVEELIGLGIIPIMLTGDNARTASFVAKEAGISYFKADLLPNEKLSFVEKTKKLGKVMMVGDGINDAPSLTSADIGVAIGAGSDIALDSSDVVLMKSSLRDVAASIRLSRRASLNIKENLFWAFFYNIIMIPIASGAFSSLGLAKLKPWYGALAMALSSFCVVLNALRINLIHIYSGHGRDKKGKITSEEIKSLLDDKGESCMKKVIKIEGMMCEHCASHVKNALLGVNGVKSVEVSLAEKKAIVEIDTSSNNDSLADAIAKAGYKVISIED